VNVKGFNGGVKHGMGNALTNAGPEKGWLKRWRRLVEDGVFEFEKRGGDRIPSEGQWDVGKNSITSKNALA